MYTDLEFSDTTYSENVKNELETTKERVLILEDDFTFKPLWTSVIKHECPDAHIDWVQTEEAAERCIQLRRKMGQKYDLVVADIFLSGRKTGIDLWTRFGQTIENFVFVSSLPRDKFDTLVSADDKRYPVYIQKPLRASVCADVVRELLGAKEEGTTQTNE